MVGLGSRISTFWVLVVTCVGGGVFVVARRCGAGCSLLASKERERGAWEMGWLWMCLGGGPSIQSAKASKSHRVRCTSQCICRLFCGALQIEMRTIDLTRG